MTRGKSYARSRMQSMKRKEIFKLKRSPRSSERSSQIQSEQFTSKSVQTQTSHSDVYMFSSRTKLPAGVNSGLRTKNGSDPFWPAGTCESAEVYSRYSYRNEEYNFTLNSYTSYLTQDTNGHHEGNVLKRGSVLTRPVDSRILENSKSMLGSNFANHHLCHYEIYSGTYFVPNIKKYIPAPNLRDSSFLQKGNFFRPIRGQNPQVDPQISRYPSKALPPRESFYPELNVVSRHFPHKFNFPDPDLISNKNATDIPPQVQSNLHDSSLSSDASERTGDRIHSLISRNSSEAMPPGKNLHPTPNVVSDPLPRHFHKQRSTLIPNTDTKNIPRPTPHLRDSSLPSDGDAFKQIGDRIPPEDPPISAKSINESTVTIPTIQKFSFPNSNLIPSINVKTGRDSPLIPLIPLDGTELSEEEERKFRDTRILTEDYFKKLHEEKLNKPMNSSGSEESSVQSSISQIFSSTDLFLREVPSESSGSKLEVLSEYQQSESPESKLDVPSESDQKESPKTKQEVTSESPQEVPLKSQQKESPEEYKLEVSFESQMQVSTESKLEVPLESQQEESQISKLEVPLESQQEESLVSKLEVPLESQQEESPEESKLEVPPESQLKVSLQPHSESPPVLCQHGNKFTFTVPHFPLDTFSFEKRTTPELESDYHLDFETTDLMDNGHCALDEVTKVFPDNSDQVNSFESSQLSSVTMNEDVNSEREQETEQLTVFDIIPFLRLLL